MLSEIRSKIICPRKKSFATPCHTVPTLSVSPKQMFGQSYIYYLTLWPESMETPRRPPHTPRQSPATHKWNVTIVTMLVTPKT